MFYYIQFLILVSIVFGSPIELAQNESIRIMGGNITTIEKRPYMVSIMIGGDFSCGGSILNSRWILTAGHCINDPNITTVRVGSSYKNELGKKFNVKRTIQHPKFISTGYITNYDAGLIDLGADVIPLDGKTMVPVELNPAPVTAGTKVDLSGWGYMGDEESTNVLMEIETKIFDMGECKKKLVPFIVFDYMICIAPGPKNACHGDSGSPLVISGTKKQIGLTSFGPNSTFCPDPSFPVVFTNVFYLEIRNWIKNITGV